MRLLKIQTPKGILLAQNIKGVLWVHHGHKTFSVDSIAQQKKFKQGASSSGSTQITAPMPGKITQILVTPGSTLEAGAPVLVMEAMKMEYTLKAEVDGVLSTLDAKIGEQVPLGKVLARLQKKGETQ